MNSLDQQLFNNPNPNTVRSLLQRGANPNAQDEDGRTPLYYAGVSFEALELGIVDPNDPDYDGPAEDSYIQVAEALLEAGADPDFKDRYGTPVICGFPEDEMNHLLRRLAIWQRKAELSRQIPQPQPSIHASAYDAVHHQEQCL